MNFIVRSCLENLIEYFDEVCTVSIITYELSQYELMSQILPHKLLIEAEYHQVINAATSK